MPGPLISCTILVLCVTCGWAVIIPRDETDARRMLAVGTIDSALWVRIAPYYDNPISVPAGELHVCAEIIPEHAAAFPSAAEIELYTPWSPGSIRRFFDDYPFLADLSPILSFDETQYSPLGSVRFSLPRRTVMSPTAPIVMFNAEPVKGFGGEGRFTSDTDGITWGRRAVFAGIPHGGIVRIGNYHPDQNDGLFLGYFPAGNIDTAPPARQALYGTVAAWNGVHWSGAIGSRMRSEAFCHYRGTEQAIALRSDVTVVKGVRVDAGLSALSGLSGDGAIDTLWAVHCGTDLRRGPWRVRIRLCRASDGGNAIPVTGTIGHENNGTRISLYSTFLPAGFPGRYSPLVRAAVRATGGDSLRRDALWLGMAVDRRVTPSVKVNITLAQTRTQGHSYGRASVSCAGSGPLEYRADYSCTQSDGQEGVNGLWHDASLSVSRALTIRLSAETRIDVSAAGDQTGFRGRLTLPVRIAAGLSASPYVQGSAGRSETDVRIGLLHELHLARQVSGSCVIELPCRPFSPDQLTIGVRSSFLL